MLCEIANSKKHCWGNRVITKIACRNAPALRPMYTYSLWYLYLFLIGHDFLFY
jgi:hypothetical protein